MLPPRKATVERKKDHFRYSENIIIRKLKQPRECKTKFLSEK